MSSPRPWSHTDLQIRHLDSQYQDSVYWTDLQIWECSAKPTDRLAEANSTDWGLLDLAYAHIETRMAI